MLPNITHLSLQWNVTHYCSPTLKEFLEHPSTVVLVLWMAGSMSKEGIETELSWQGLAQAHVVLLVTPQIPVFMLDGGFWPYAECITQWQHVNKGARCLSMIYLQISISSIVKDLRCPAAT